MHGETTKIPLKSTILSLKSKAFLTFHNSFLFNYKVSLGTIMYLAK